MIITGLVRIVADGELRFTNKGDAVLNLRAVYDYGQKGDDGNKPSQFLDLTIWGKQAEAVSQYMTKGKLLSIVGQDPCIETYEGKNGKGYTMKARVTSFEFAGGPRQEGSDRPAASANVPAQNRAPSSNRPAPGADPFNDIPNDLPF